MRRSHPFTGESRDGGSQGDVKTFQSVPGPSDGHVRVGTDSWKARRPLGALGPNRAVSPEPDAFVTRSTGGRGTLDPDRSPVVGVKTFPGRFGWPERIAANHDVGSPECARGPSR